MAGSGQSVLKDDTQISDIGEMLCGRAIMRSSCLALRTTFTNPTRFSARRVADAPTDCDTATGDEALIACLHKEVISERGLNALERVLRGAPSFLYIEKVNCPTKAVEAGHLFETAPDHGFDLVSPPIRRA